MEQHKEEGNILEQEERSNVMKMNKWYAGLIAFAAGFALSVGTASAQLGAATETRGQVSGDPRAMKLVPFYEVSDSRFTAIGIQNLSKGMADETYTKANDPDPTNNITERFLVDVSAYDAGGMMAAAGTVCLEADAFGSVVFMMGEDTMVMGSNTDMVTIYLPDMSMGYAELKLDTMNRYKDCGGRVPVADGTVDGTPPGAVVDTTNMVGEEKMAVWAILQDVGSGFFGTEIPTASIMREVDTDDRSIMHLACRDDVDGTASADSGSTPTSDGTGFVSNTGGHFDVSRCGVIPDEFDKATEADGADAGDSTAEENPTTMVAARFDITEFNGSMSDIFVWLDTAKQPNPNNPLDPGTFIAATVYCEDGEAQLAPDGNDAGDDPDFLLIPTHQKVTVINSADHAMLNGNLGDYTSKCMDMDGMGGRGTLRFNMPGGSQGGMIWTHISQADSHYRMNFQANSVSPADG